MSELRTLFGRGSIYSVVTVVQSLLGFLVLPFLTRLLGPSRLGIVALALLVAQGLTIIACFGLPMSVTRQFFLGSNGRIASRSLVTHALITATAVTLVATLLAPFWAPLVVSVDAGLALTIAALSALPAAGVLLSQSFLRAANRVVDFVIVGILASVGGQALGISLVAVVGGDPELYLLGVLGGQSLGFLWAIWCVRPTWRLPDRRATLLNALRIGLPTIPHSVALFGLGILSRFIVERQIGIAAAGRFQVAYVIGMLPATMLGALNNAWAPLVMGQGLHRRWQVLASTSKAVHALTATAVTVLALGAPVALVVAAPPTYDRATLSLVAGLVSLSAVGNVVYLSRAHVVFITGRTSVLAILTPLSFAVAGCVGVIAVSEIGLLGAALVTPLAFGLQGATLAIVARRLVRVPWQPGSITLWLAASPPIALGLVLPSAGVWMIVRVGLAIAITILAVFKFRRLLLGQAVTSTASLPVRRLGTGRNRTNKANDNTLE